jgi:hypothetical protein
VKDEYDFSNGKRGPVSTGGHVAPGLMRFKHAGEWKTPELFLRIVRAHLPTVEMRWLTQDQLLKEALDALESMLVQAVGLDATIARQHEIIKDQREWRRLKEDCFKTNLKHQDELAERIKTLTRELNEARALCEAARCQKLP